MSKSQKNEAFGSMESRSQRREQRNRNTRVQDIRLEESMQSISNYLNGDAMEESAQLLAETFFAEEMEAE